MQSLYHALVRRQLGDQGQSFGGAGSQRLPQSPGYRQDMQRVSAQAQPRAGGPPVGVPQQKPRRMDRDGTTPFSDIVDKVYDQETV